MHLLLFYFLYKIRTIHAALQPRFSLTAFCHILLSVLWSRWRRLAERAPRDRPPIDRSFLACTAERRLNALFSPVTFTVSSLAESDFLHHGRQEEPHKVKAVASVTGWGLSGGRSTKKKKERARSMDGALVLHSSWRLAAALPRVNYLCKLKA